ncbi:MAG: metallophosphoesterase [Cyclobacteriaceae bacterium]
MKILGSLIFISIFTFVLLLLNWYVYQGYKTLLPESSVSGMLSKGRMAYWVIMGGISLWVAFTFFTIMKEGKISTVSQKSLNLFLTVTITQLTIIIFLFGEDLYRSIYSLFSYFNSNHTEHQPYFADRRKFISQLAFAVAAIPFAGVVYGIVKGKYDFRVIRKTLYFEDLPDAFDGFTITQLSDIHAGSFTDYKAVQKGIDLAAAQEADLFVFTGDLVNHNADEIEPLLEAFSKIKAPFGQFSILGNHDYGDYSSWPSEKAKKENFENLKNQHKKLGYRLMLDENATIEKDGQKIKILGVENWGVGFHARGDLDKALEGVSENDFKILLSHDPSHWDKKVKKHPNKIHLTLSGHTHGMQFGIETPLIKWSPHNTGTPIGQEWPRRLEGSSMSTVVLVSMPFREGWAFGRR